VRHLAFFRIDTLFLYTSVLSLYFGINCTSNEFIVKFFAEINHQVVRIRKSFIKTAFDIIKAGTLKSMMPNVIVFLEIGDFYRGAFLIREVYERL